jgi:hypothetical protein
MRIARGISVTNTSRPVGITYDADAQAFITASGISGTEATAVNTLVVNLKSANIWIKMKAVYPFVGNTASSQKWNLKDARDLNAAYRLSFVGGGTFSANGYLPNGVNAYADTFLTPSTTLSLNNSHLSLYNRTNATSYFNATKIDALLTTNISMTITPTSTDYGGRFMDDTYSVISSPNALGYYIGNRTLSTQKKYYKNGALGGTFNVNSIALPDNILRIGVFVGNGFTFYSSGQCAFASIGDGLTDAEALTLYNAVQTFQTTLGRQV